MTLMNFIFNSVVLGLAIGLVIAGILYFFLIKKKT